MEQNAGKNSSEGGNSLGNASDKVSSREKPLTVKLSFFYALMITCVYFAFDWAGFTFISSSPPSDNFVHTVDRLLPTPPIDSGEQQFNDYITVLLYTDEAAKVENFGWPIEFSFLTSLLEDLTEEDYRLGSDSNDSTGTTSKPNSIFFDIVFRTPGNNHQSFCTFARTLSDITGYGKEFIAAINAGNSPDSCITYISNMDQYLAASNRQLVPCLNVSEHNAKEVVVHCGSAPETEVILGADLEFLNARYHYLECKQLSGSHCPEGIIAAKKRYEGAIRDWPGLALLAPFVRLAPIAVGADDGASMHLLVDTVEHQAPPLLMLCHEANKENHPEICGSLSKYATENLGLDWRTTPDPRLLRDMNQNKEGNNSKLSEEARDDLLTQFEHCKLDGGDAYYRKLWADFFSSTIFRAQAGDHIMDVTCPSYITIDLAARYSNQIKWGAFRESIKKSHVIIGTKMARFDDYVKSPIYGELPGVYAYATAMDNLLTHQGRISAATKEKKHWKNVFLNLFKWSVVVCSITLILVMKERFKKCARSTVSCWLFRGVFVLFTFGVALMFLNTRLDSGIGLHGYFALLILSAIFVFSWAVILTDRYPDQQQAVGVIGFHLLVLFLLSNTILFVSLIVGKAINAFPYDWLSVLYLLIPFYILLVRNQLVDCLSQLVSVPKIHVFFANLYADSDDVEK